MVRVTIPSLSSPRSVSDLGRIYFLAGRYDEALNTLEGAVSITAKNPEGLFYLGRSQMELGRLEKAGETFRTAIQMDKDYLQVYYFLGETDGRLNNMPDAHYYLGIYYFRKGQYRTARYHLTRARRMLHDPTKLEDVNQALEVMGPMPKDSEQR